MGRVSPPKEYIRIVVADHLTRSPKNAEIATSRGCKNFIPVNVEIRMMSLTLMRRLMRRPLGDMNNPGQKNCAPFFVLQNEQYTGVQHFSIGRREGLEVLLPPKYTIDHDTKRNISGGLVICPILVEKTSLRSHYLPSTILTCLSHVIPYELNDTVLSWRECEKKSGFLQAHFYTHR